MIELSKLSKDQFITAYSSLNSWVFPTFLRHLQPTNWGEMSMSEQFDNEVFQSITNVVYVNTTEYERSWAWWQYCGLDPNGTEHRVWWRRLTSTPRWMFWFNRYSPAKNCSRELRSMILEERKENLTVSRPDFRVLAESVDVKV